MNKVIRFKLDVSLFIVSIVHVVRTTGNLFSDYDLKYLHVILLLQETVTKIDIHQVIMKRKFNS